METVKDKMLKRKRKKEKKEKKPINEQAVSSKEEPIIAEIHQEKEKKKKKKKKKEKKEKAVLADESSHFKEEQEVIQKKSKKKEKKRTKRQHDETKEVDAGIEQDNKESNSAVAEDDGKGGDRDTNINRQEVAENEPEAETEDEDDSSPKKYESLRVFIGQLPYHATKGDIQEHFNKHGVGEVKNIRLLTDRRTGRSRGIAFAEMKDSKQVVRVLRVHHTRLKGRMINVERTCGGGGNSEKRKTKLKALKERQGNKVIIEVRKKVEEIFNEVKPINVKLEDVDDRALEALGTFPREISEAIVKEYFELDFTGVNNKKAYLMGMVRKYRNKLQENEDFVPETNANGDLDKNSENKNNKKKRRDREPENDKKQTGFPKTKKKKVTNF
mmetsp:Transcript_16430/g.18575  ORF Transcript_16430/g.18575 Transcript_16430/m.18575 type:complete len:385 (+) Transcript_16430:252-1406(+)